MYRSGHLEDKILEKIWRYPDLKFIIIDAEGINQIDETGEEMLVELRQRLNLASSCCLHL